MNMKLIEALTIMQKPSKPDADLFSVFIGCSFMPLHLKTFLSAHLRQVFPDRKIQIKTGVFGDLPGNLARLARAPVDAAAIIFEWADFDPRFGLRNRGKWNPSVLPDIQNTVSAQSNRLLLLAEDAARSTPLAVCLPSMELPPVFHYHRTQCGSIELELRQTLNAFAVKLCKIRNVKIVSEQLLHNLSPSANRIDVKSELMCGFPYRLSHASIVAELLALLIKPPLAKKGLVTDLDDTLWRGILGEVGVNGISWDIDNNSHIHALYQKVLHALAKSGILISVASRNDRQLAEKAFGREDLLLPKKCLYPLEINWGQKSASVGRILEAWNIGPESVVFVDDSPIELDEVQSVFPGITCLLFPKQKDHEGYEFLRLLRDFFAKEILLEEDIIRLDSIRKSTQLENADFVDTHTLSKFLERAEAELLFASNKDSYDPRAFQLVNKTNQFNLNGMRFEEVMWKSILRGSDAFIVTAAYKDKYGPLGKIAVILGRIKESQVLVDTWVMSCRSFGRRIEHKCIQYLFHKFRANRIYFDFHPTIRNGPLQDFFEEFLGERPETPFILTYESFMNKCPELFHKIEEA
jgi:FkbH-like protein